MLRRVLFLLPLVLLTWACSDDAQQPQEPVTTEQQTPVPDSPGADTGETPAQPAAETPAAQPVEAPAVATANEMVVNVGGLNVRSGPGTKFKSVRVLHKGEKVSAQSCEQNWCKIGEGEFVSKKFLK